MSRLESLLNRAWDAFNQSDYVPLEDWDALISLGLHSAPDVQRRILKHLIPTLKRSDLEETRALSVEIQTFLEG